MTLFHTDDDQRMQIAEVMVEMKAEGLPVQLIVGWAKLANDDQGVFEMGELWRCAPSEEDGDDALEAIQEALNDAAQEVLDEAAELARCVGD
jgi:hypothetical protein